MTTQEMINKIAELETASTVKYEEYNQCARTPLLNEARRRQVSKDFTYETTKHEIILAILGSSHGYAIARLKNALERRGGDRI
jgi:hypothetical protein